MHAAPRDELLRLVPNDYTFCVVLNDLRSLAKGDGDSSFLKGFAESPLLKQFQQSPEAQKIQGVFDTLLKDLGVSPEEFAKEILGDCVVFAYRKGPPGQPDKDDGLILVHARDEKLLARLVDRINELQTKAGELKAVESVESKSGGYFRRLKAVDNEPSDYYALRGHRLVFSGSEGLLVSALGKLDQPAVGESPLAARMKKLGVESALLACLINPRSFDGDLTASARDGKGSEQAFLKEFAGYWKAVDALAISLNFTPDVELGLSLNVRREELPKAATELFFHAAKRSPLWNQIPDDALFAAVGRLHPESLVAVLGAFLTDVDRKKVLDTIADATRPFLESEDLAPLVRGLGPDAGFWITRPDPADKTWCPQGILAVKRADGPDGQKAEEAALKGLDFVARLACLSQKELRIHTMKQGPVEVRYLTHPSAFPPGFRPGFAAKGGYLLVAGSPQIIERFNPPTQEATEAAEVPILRISVAGWRAYLKEHRKGLVEYLAAMNKTDIETLSGQLDGVLPLLDALDRIELVQRSTPERATFILRLKEAKK
jgi:hypothetical protein